MPGRRTLFDPRAVEAYLQGNSAPRFMSRLVEIESEYSAQRRRLEEAYREHAEGWDYFIPRLGEYVARLVATS